MPALLILSISQGRNCRMYQNTSMISVLNKVKETSRRKADPSGDLQDDSGGKSQGTQEETWDSD